MENQFFVDSEFLSPQALAKKHRLETDPSSRKATWNICREWKSSAQISVTRSCPRWIPTTMTDTQQQMSRLP